MEMIEDNNLRILAKRPRKLNAFAIWMPSVLPSKASILNDHWSSFLVAYFKSIHLAIPEPGRVWMANSHHFLLPWDDIGIHFLGSRRVLAVGNLKLLIETKVFYHPHFSLSITFQDWSCLLRTTKNLADTEEDEYVLSSQMKDTWFPNRSNAALFYPEIAERAHQKGWKTYLFYSAPARGFRVPWPSFPCKRLD